jgi:hypothetical protein
VGGAPVTARLNQLTDAGSIVRDLDQFLSRFRDPNGYAARTGVQGILHQFLHDGGRTLDHFACGDLRGNLG